jgi:siroheme synthase
MKNYYPMLPKKALKIFVGKRKVHMNAKVNQLIVDNALTWGVKGGDLFFGRGSEEIEFVESFGILLLFRVFHRLRFQLRKVFR